MKTQPIKEYTELGYVVQVFANEQWRNYSQIMPSQDEALANSTAPTSLKKRLVKVIEVIEIIENLK